MTTKIARTLKSINVAKFDWKNSSMQFGHVLSIVNTGVHVSFMCRDMSIQEMNTKVEECRKALEVAGYTVSTEYRHGVMELTCAA